MTEFTHLTTYNNFSEIMQSVDLNQQQLAIFLDIDGTLAEFKVDPENCFIDRETLQCIEDLQDSGCYVAVVTGRDLESAHRLLPQMNIPIAGLHGLSIEYNKNNKELMTSNHTVFKALYEQLKEKTAHIENIRIENKTDALTLHYREYPEFQAQAKAIMETLCQQFKHLKLIEGKYVYELISARANKGIAIEKLLYDAQLESPLCLFIGDDQTDEDGFKFTNKNNGISIKVGQGETTANYRLKSVSHVSSFLKQLLQLVSHTSSHSIQQYGEQHV